MSDCVSEGSQYNPCLLDESIGEERGRGLQITYDSRKKVPRNLFKPPQLFVTSSSSSHIQSTIFFFPLLPHPNYISPLAGKGISSHGHIIDASTISTANIAHGRRWCSARFIADPTHLRQQRTANDYSENELLTRSIGGGD